MWQTIETWNDWLTDGVETYSPLRFHQLGTSKADFVVSACVHVCCYCGTLCECNKD